MFTISNLVRSDPEKFQSRLNARKEKKESRKDDEKQSSAQGQTKDGLSVSIQYKVMA